VPPSSGEGAGPWKGIFDPSFSVPLPLSAASALHLPTHEPLYYNIGSRTRIWPSLKIFAQDLIQGELLLVHDRRVLAIPGLNRLDRERLIQRRRHLTARREAKDEVLDALGREGTLERGEDALVLPRSLHTHAEHKRERSVQGAAVRLINSADVTPIILSLTTRSTCLHPQRMHPWLFQVPC
jgi:hypothetical protein